MIFDNTLIVSPHCDDIALGMGAWLSTGKFSSSDVVVVFSSSCYTAYGLSNIDAVTHRRKLEEQKAIGKLVSKFCFMDLHDTSILKKNESRGWLEVVYELLKSKVQLCSYDNIFLPLGLTSHIDHTIVSLLYENLIHNVNSIYFYEDVGYHPYNVKPGHLIDLIIQRNLFIRNETMIIRTGIEEKKKILGKYKTQNALRLIDLSINRFVELGGEAIYKINRYPW